MSAARLLLLGHPISDVARRIRVHRYTITRWMRSTLFRHELQRQILVQTRLDSAAPRNVAQHGAAQTNAGANQTQADRLLNAAPRPRYHLQVLRTLLLFALAPLLIAASPGAVVTPAPVAQTDPVPHRSDAADDPAIWIHPTDSAQSLILGTDKQGALMVYDLAGKQIQAVSKNCEPNNVDVIYDFPLAPGRNIDLAIASTRGLADFGVKIWIIHPLIRRLEDVTHGQATGGEGDAVRVFKRTTPYGVCAYRSAKTGKHYFIVNNKLGEVEQYELTAVDGKKVGAKLVRAFKLPSQLEGMVADHELGWLYLGEESKGVWKVSAEPDAADKPKLIIKSGENGLHADVEGLCIYTAKDGKGYLIVSSQGNNTFKVYRREGDNEFVLTIDPRAGKIDDVNDTDGIDVTHRPCGDLFPKGFFIVQDGGNGNKNQNFKMYRWDDIAGDNLIIDTSVDPRK